MCQEIQEQGLLKVLDVGEKFRVENVYKVWEEEGKYQIESVYEGLELK